MGVATKFSQTFITSEWLRVWRSARVLSQDNKLPSDVEKERRGYRLPEPRSEAARSRGAVVKNSPRHEH